jgi:hypothetical protein
VLNNGQPWLHAKLIAAATPRPGEHAVHIGAGLGYYTAILAHMVGESGQVTAIEFDGSLALAGNAERCARSFRDKHEGGKRPGPFDQPWVLKAEGVLFRDENVANDEVVAAGAARRSASRTGRQLIRNSSGTEPVSAFAQLLLLQHAHRIL